MGERGTHPEHQIRRGSQNHLSRAQTLCPTGVATSGFQIVPSSCCLKSSRAGAGRACMAAVSRLRLFLESQHGNAMGRGLHGSEGLVWYHSRVTYLSILRFLFTDVSKATTLPYARYQNPNPCSPFYCQNYMLLPPFPHPPHCCPAWFAPGTNLAWYTIDFSLIQALWVEQSRTMILTIKKFLLMKFLCFWYCILLKKSTRERKAWGN